MKNALLFGILLLAVNAMAGDTLTRAQVYNFGINDTFDYKFNGWYTSYNPVSGNVITIDSTRYSRYSVADIFYSIDSTIKYITRSKIFPLPLSVDTLQLGQLSENEVFLDTSINCGSPAYWWSVAFGNSSVFHNRTVDTLFQSTCAGPDFTTTICADGLGIALLSYQTGVLSQRSGYSNELIYYSKGAEKWGKPYYDFPNGIHQLNTNTGQIIIAPNINDGTFVAKINEPALLPATLFLYDIEGREVEQLHLNGQSNVINLTGLNAGLYIWKGFHQGQLVETGKMVVR